MAEIPNDDADAVRARIDALLKQGKNVYQPLYNYPYATGMGSLRPCGDRCDAVWAAMRKERDGLRLWDAGCSLGYNTLYFVDRGLTGFGTDIDPRNIAICREIAPYTQGAARFERQELNRESVDAIVPGSFDCAFFFSVLHHIIERRGLRYVQGMTAALMERIPVLYVELAQAHETPPPGYEWDAHLPENELSIFDDCAAPEITLIGRFPTHVCDVDRPLYRVARR